MSEILTESRKALRELIETLREVDERWAGPQWNIERPEDVVGAHRALLHMLEGGLVGHLEADPSHPQFRRIVTPSRKFTGDNADAIYFDAPLSARHAYRVRGTMDGAVYVSLTVEAGDSPGGLGNRTAGVINDTQLDVAADGSFEIFLGGPQRERGWLLLEPDAYRVTTRHYYEEASSAARDPARGPRMSIEVVDDVGPAAPPDDASVAAGIRRVIRFVRSRTLDSPPMSAAPPAPFVSTTPNAFPAPVPPADMGLAAADAAYSMAPYLVGPDQALVMTGRWPRCRFANVTLWNRFQQSYDYATRQISLNRRQTRLEPDGSFRMVIAHRDPGVPNWIDTEGRPFGLVFWRYMLPEGEIDTPQAHLVPLAEVADWPRRSP